MEQNDKQLILALSDRLRQAHPVPQKDEQAAALIRDAIGSQPESLYLLTQAVIVQEQALRQLQQQVANLQAQVNQPRGLFGRLFGSRPQPQPLYQQAPYQQAPYQQTAYQQPQYQQPVYRSGPSFLGQAMTTAVGVAGGMMLFEGLNSMFNGASGGMTGQQSMMDPGMTDPFAAQSQMLDSGFGNGDDFSGGGFDSSNLGDW